MKFKTELVLVGVAALGLAYVAWRVKSTASAAGNAISGAAGAGWTLVNTPVLDPSIPGASIGNAIVAAPANTLDTFSFGTVGGTTAPGASWFDTLKAGPLGGVVGMLTGDNNANIFGPAPSAGLDFGNTNGNW
jgi:hypothetical protein